MNRKACVITPDYTLASLCVCVLDRAGYEATHIEGPQQLPSERYQVLLHDHDSAPAGLSYDIADHWIALTRIACHHQRWKLINNGYSDYVLCPFPPEELETKLQLPVKEKAKKLDLIGPWSFNREALTLTHIHKHESQRLSASECVLLAKLVDARGRICAPHHLLNALEESGLPSKATTLPVLVNKLRQRIEPKPHEPVFLLTMKTMGYRLVSD